MFWNPDLGRADVAAYAAAAAQREFARHPEQESFSLGINDGLIFGESPETLALVTPARWFRGRPDYSRLVFTFMNRAAEDLSRTQPQKLLGALAYYWAENAPDFPLHPQVVPFLTADRSQGYDRGFYREEFQLQERWAAAAGADTAHAPPKSGEPLANASPLRRLGLYDYLYGGGFLVPRVTPHLIADNLRHARAVGFTDYYAEVNPNWGLDGPMPWIVAQLLQNPHQSVDGLLDEYYRRFFQAAAAPMRQFFTRCEQQWMRQAGPPFWLKYYRNESQAELFPAAVCAELRALLNAADRLASSDIVRQRVAFVSEAFGVTERFVAMQEARAALTHQELRGELRSAGAGADVVHYLDRRKEFIADASRLLREQPLALFPINFDDFLRDDPSFGAIVSLVTASADGADRTRDALGARPEVFVATAIAAGRALQKGDGREVLPNGSLEGALVRGRVIAGLPYGIDLPAPWHSQVEPTEHHVGVVVATAAHSGEQGLRISGAENTTVFQWLPAVAGQLYVAGVNARGAVSPGNIVTLTLGWLDAKQAHIGSVVAANLPAGLSSDWAKLRQGAYAPANAAWVGIGIRVQHQTGDDWAEFDDFSLRESHGR